MNQTKTYYQTGSIASLLAGCYDGDRSIAQVLQHGNFGLGTVDAVAGELIIDQGKCYLCDANGCASLVDPEATSPFCVVTEHTPDQLLRIEPWQTMAQLFEQLDTCISVTRNQMHAFRIEATFDQIDARSECAQPSPYQPLAKTLPKLQTQLQWQNIHGVLVITYFPTFMSSINAQGYHVHFISTADNVGGHVFDCKIEQACTVEHCRVDRLVMDSISNDCYNNTAITPVSADSSDAVEKK